MRALNTMPSDVTISSFVIDRLAAFHTIKKHLIFPSIFQSLLILNMLDVDEKPNVCHNRQLKAECSEAERRF